MKQSNNKPFDKVYELVRKIPKGRVTTYGAIAKKLSMFPRIVGYALHLNPNGKRTPCHRVVNRDGRVASSYAFGGPGGQKKRLEEEGVNFRDESHVDLTKHLLRTLIGKPDLCCSDSCIF